MMLRQIVATLYFSLFGIGYYFLSILLIPEKLKYQVMLGILIRNSTIPNILIPAIDLFLIYGFSAVLQILTKRGTVKHAFLNVVITIIAAKLIRSSVIVPANSIGPHVPPFDDIILPIIVGVTSIILITMYMRKTKYITPPRKIQKRILAIPLSMFLFGFLTHYTLFLNSYSLSVSKEIRNFQVPVFNGAEVVVDKKNRWRKNVTFTLKKETKMASLVDFYTKYFSDYNWTPINIYYDDKGRKHMGSYTYETKLTNESKNIILEIEIVRHRDLTPEELIEYPNMNIPPPYVKVEIRNSDIDKWENINQKYY